MLAVWSEPPEMEPAPPVAGVGTSRSPRTSGTPLDSLEEKVAPGSQPETFQFGDVVNAFAWQLERLESPWGPSSPPVGSPASSRRPRTCAWRMKQCPNLTSGLNETLLGDRRWWVDDVYIRVWILSYRTSWKCFLDGWIIASNHWQQKDEGEFQEPGF